MHSLPIRVVGGRMMRMSYEYTNQPINMSMYRVSMMPANGRRRSARPEQAAEGHVGGG